MIEREENYMLKYKNEKNLELDKCDCKTVEANKINSRSTRAQNLADLTRLAEFFSVIGDLTRVRIISALEASEMCVCDIALSLDMSQSAISHQLKVLKDARLVKNRREGKKIFYSLKDHHIENIFNQGFIHIKEEN